MRARLKYHQSSRGLCWNPEVSFESLYINVLYCMFSSLSLRCRFDHDIPAGPAGVALGAKLPSILRFASCLSSFVTHSSFLGISGSNCG